MGEKSAKKAPKGDGELQVTGDFLIKPAGTPALDTSKWPLLLKNYDKLCVRTGAWGGGRVRGFSAPNTWGSGVGGCPLVLRGGPAPGAVGRNAAGHASARREICGRRGWGNKGGGRGAAASRSVPPVPARGPTDTARPPCLLPLRAQKNRPLHADPRGLLAAETPAV